MAKNFLELFPHGKFEKFRTTVKPRLLQLSRQHPLVAITGFFENELNTLVLLYCYMAFAASVW